MITRYSIPNTSPLDTTEHIQPILNSEGCLVLEDLFSTECIRRCHQVFLQKYKRYLKDVLNHSDSQRVGHKRWMVTVTLEPPFSDPNLIANPHLLALAESVLGPEMILNNFGVVVSLPGAQEQHDHRDLPALFGNTPIDYKLPCYALTVLVPLIDLNSSTGSTRLRPQSHKVPEAEAETMPGQAPDVSVGSCMLMDYRLQHGGTANLSDQPRPLLFFVYSRPWFRDYRNFRKQEPLQIRRHCFRKMPPSQQNMLRFAQKKWW